MEPFKPIDTMSFDDPVTEAHEVTPKEDKVLTVIVPKDNSIFNNLEVEKIRFVCKTQERKKEEGKPDWFEDCGGTIEGTPVEILNNKEFKWKMQCPKCKAEFSRGRQMHLQMDMAKAVAEMFRVLTTAPFAVEFILKTPTKPAPAPVQAKTA